MRRWGTVAALLVVVGAVGVALPSFRVVSVGGGATYYVETEAVDREATSDGSEVRSLASLPDSTADAVRQSLNQTGSPTELASRPDDPAPEYVSHENATYRVSVWHVDHGPTLSGILAWFGGWVLVALGGVGVLAALVRRAVRGN